MSLPSLKPSEELIAEVRAFTKALLLPNWIERTAETLADRLEVALRHRPAIVIPEGHAREELIACAERELKMRESHYPKWVELGSMRAKFATEQTEAMRAIVAVLRQLPAEPPAQGGLFK